MKKSSVLALIFAFTIPAISSWGNSDQGQVAEVSKRILEYRVGNDMSKGESAGIFVRASVSQVESAKKQIREILLTPGRYPEGFVYKSPIKRIGQKTEYPEREASLRDLQTVFEKIQILANAYALKGTEQVENPYYRDPELAGLIIEALESLYVYGVNERVNIPHFLPSEEEIAKLKSRPTDEGHLSGIKLRLYGYFHALMVVAEQLQSEGELEKFARTAGRMYGQIFHYIGEPFFGMHVPAPTPEMTHFLNTDELILYENYAMPLIAILNTSGQSDSAAKLLFQTQRALNESLLATEAWNAGWKRSGLGNHHSNAYLPGYTGDALLQATKMVNQLHGTEFAVQDEVYANLRNAVLRTRLLLNKSTAPIGVTGRGGSGNTSINQARPYLASMLYLALLPGEEPDEELLEAYSRMISSEQDLKQNILPGYLYGGRSATTSVALYQMHDSVVGMAVEPEVTPQGHWIYPETYLSIHRRDEWMASVKARGKYVWNAESGITQNHYGQQMNDGVLLLYSKGEPIISHVGSGYKLDSGWDWYRWPGTTTIHHQRPWVYNPEINRRSERLGQARYYNSEYQRIFNNETCVGGTALDGNGVFGMRYVDAPLYGGHKPSNLSANKSYFFFDDLIVLLGSDIYGGNREDRVNTTLFQSWMGDSKGDLVSGLSSVEINGEVFEELPSIGQFGDFKKQLKGPVTITDPYNNGYYIPQDERLFVQQSDQGSLLTQGDRRDMSYGYYTTAWIDHGIDPLEDDYAYAILVDGADRIESLASDPESYFQILQQDFRAHIVHHPKSSMTGYVFFNGRLREQVVADDAIVRHADNDCMVLTRAVGNATLKLAVTDPDMGWLKENERVEYDMAVNVYQGRKSVPSELTLTLEGEWTPESGNPAIRGFEFTDDGQTILRIECYDGQPSVVILDGN